MALKIEKVSLEPVMIRSTYVYIRYNVAMAFQGKCEIL